MEMNPSLPFMGAKATRSASQAIANNTIAAISFAAVEFDVGGWWSSGSPTVLTVPAAANGRILLIIGALDLAGNASGSYRTCNIRVNGAALAQTLQIPPGAIHVSFSPSIMATAVTGDTYDMTVHHDSGVSINTEVANFASSLSVAVLG